MGEGKDKIGLMYMIVVAENYYKKRAKMFIELAPIDILLFV